MSTLSLPKGILNKERAGFTLMEVLVVLIIIGILVGLSIPNYTKTRERAIDKEAQTVLSLVQAAERMYRLKAVEYYPFSGVESNINNINTNLKLNLASPSQRWNYSIQNTATGFTASAARIGGARTWQIDQDDTKASCSGSPCPPP